MPTCLCSIINENDCVNKLFMMFIESSLMQNLGCMHFPHREKNDDKNKICGTRFIRAELAEHFIQLWRSSRLTDYSTRLKYKFKCSYLQYFRFYQWSELKTLVMLQINMRTKYFSEPKKDLWCLKINLLRSLFFLGNFLWLLDIYQIPLPLSSAPDFMSIREHINGESTGLSILFTYETQSNR